MEKLLDILVSFLFVVVLFVMVWIMRYRFMVSGSCSEMSAGEFINLLFSFIFLSFFVRVLLLNYL